jgi:NAD(P)-dependent dehydrogenase (short-subunit alcohol dehydrogenase family)
MDIKGRNAVVTGGGSGIGRGIALALAKAGAAVAIADIMLDNAQAVAAEIAQAGGRAVAVQCDVCDRASVKAMRDEAERQLGPIAILVANAGVTLFENLIEMSDADVDWVIDVSLYGVVHCVQAFLPGMVERGHGHIVATASSAGLLAPFHDQHAPYCGAKAGIIGFILALRNEVAKDNVGASVLCPGFVESRITASKSYRPPSYGGPTGETVVLPLAGTNHPPARPAEEAGEMVAQAIVRNRAIISTDASHRPGFQAGMVALVQQSYDDAAEFDRLRGR